MKRFDTITSYGNLQVIDYTLPVTPKTDYIVDDSNFIPMSEAVKQLGANNIGANDIKNYYDFPDGEDNGMEIPISRTKNGKDIAEISSAIMEKVDDMSEKVRNAREIANKKAELEQSINNIQQSSNDTPKTE